MSEFYQQFCKETFDADGHLIRVDPVVPEHFNFAYDVVDEIARQEPDRRAMLWTNVHGAERTFTFAEMKKYSDQAAGVLRAHGVGKGDAVMLVMGRHYQFWFAILACHKLGAVAIPGTHLLTKKDFVYRFQAASVKAIICLADGETAAQADLAMPECPTVTAKFIISGQRDGWIDFDGEMNTVEPLSERVLNTPDDPMLMYFTSGTTGYPKMVLHSFSYPIGHIITAKYWQCVVPDGLHLSVADTGWGKAVWGKLYGQWLCEAATFVYDFDRFDAAHILPMFGKYHVTTFCAPPTMYRMLVKEDLSQYDFSSLEHATTAGEALNPEVYKQFEAATGLQIMEGFGQSESTCMIGNLAGQTHKLGSMGRPCPIYDVHLLTADGTEAAQGETGEICVNVADGAPCGLFMGYYRDPEKTAECWYDGFYHTGDLAWRDEDGFLWYVGRRDDVIKSSGYRIGPFEIENVIMELPYVLECGVSAAPDPVRGQVVKASIVLTKGTEGTEELKKEIQTYVKKNTAPYKYPRIVVFCTELPKTVSGKIMRNKL